jgi:hypothetical protein
VAGKTAIAAPTAASALAGDRNIFVAIIVVAAAPGSLGNRPRYFVRIDAPIGGGLGKIARLAIGSGSMRTAFCALGEALVDAIAISLVLDNENPAVSRCSRRCEEKRTGQKR